MNKNNHRIVFNESRGCLMAVAETASACGQSARGERASRAAREAGVSTWRLSTAMLAVAALWGALGLVDPLWAQTVATRIVADPSVARTKQATVLRSANGVVQVDIQTPSSAGVSRNVFSQFDVGGGTGGGAILNNSRSNVQTELGGWVQGNPWLITGTARVIVNEVNSSAPSQLRGMVEVAGNKAEVVVANPAGLVIDGAGFINASRVTLTTGTPVWHAGNLESYRVSRGTLRIDGLGLDTRGSDYTAILARALEVNAGIWAKTLQVVTGANQITADSLRDGSTPQTQRIAGEGAAPAFALDVAALGGMYAGKIHLIGTEAGLGVRNAGLVQSNAGPLVISQDGWLSNSGSLLASGDASVNTTGTVQNSGLIYSTGNLAVTTQASQTHSGTTAAQGHVQLSAQGAADQAAQTQLNASARSLIAAGLQTDGQVRGAQNLTINASGQAQLLGQTLASGQLDVAAMGIVLDGGRVSAAQANLLAGTDKLTARGAQINVAQTLALHTPQQLVTDDATVQAQRLDVLASALSNQRGSLQHSGTSDLAIDLHGGTLDNTGGQLVANASGLSLASGQLINTGGLIAHAGSGELAIRASAIDNRRGQVLGNGTAQVRSTGALDNADGLLSARGALTLSSTDIHNTRSAQVPASTATGLQSQQGDLVLHAHNVVNSSGIYAGQNLDATLTSLDNSASVYAAAAQSLSVQERLNNTGTIAAGQGLRIQAQELSASSTSLMAAGLDGDAQLSGLGQLSITTAQAQQNAGRLLATQGMSLQGSRLDLSQAQAATTGGAMSLQAQTGDILTAQSRLQSAGLLSIRTQSTTAQLDNRKGQLSGEQLDIQVGSLNNREGRIEQTGQDRAGAAALTARIQTTGQLDNSSGRIVANARDFSINSAALDNTDGLLGHAGSGSLQLSAASVDNTRGRLLSNGALSLTSEGALNNSDGLLAASALQVRAGALNNQKGQVYSDHDGALRVASLDNRGGQVLAVQALDVQATGPVDNTGSLLRAGGAVSLTAAQIVNAQTAGTDQGIEGDSVRLVSDQIDNRQGAVRAAQGLQVQSDGALRNADGLLSAGGVLNVGTHQASTASLTLDNLRGQIVGNSAIQLRSASLNNAEGTIASKGDVGLSLQGDHTTAGTLQAGRDLQLSTTGTLTNPVSLQAGRHLSVSAANIDNTASGQLLSAATTLLQATQTLSNRGLIDGADTRIQADTVDNVGTGRIYGDRVAIAANTLLNREESVNGVSKTATIAARERLDIGAKNITNREGALIYSAGDMAIGGALDAQWHASGQAQSLGNNSATIEAAGNLAINAQSVRNTNEHYATELRPWGTPKDYFYIQPSGSTQKYLENAFTWWSNGELTTYAWAAPTGTPEAGKTPLLTPRTEQSCSGEGEAQVCTYVPGSEYPATDPAWAYFKLTPPPAEPRKPTLTEPVAPTLVAPVEPQGADSCKVGASSYNATQCSAYTAALAQYQLDKAAYDAAWSSYDTLKTEYDTAWAQYKDAHAQWDAADDAAYEALSDKIATYNAGFKSGSFVYWTQYQVTRTFEKSVVTQTAPGQILSGGDLLVQGESLLNDKSQIIAGGALGARVDTLQNVQGPGQFLTHEDGTAQGHGTRTVRVCCIRKKTKDSWGAATPYHDTQTEDIELPVIVFEQNASNASSGYSAAAQQAVGAVQQSAQAAGQVAAGAAQQGAATGASGPSGVQGAAARAAAATANAARTASLPSRVPNTSLYKTNPDSQAQYLVETDPQFAGYRHWLGTDYLLGAYGQNPQAMQKRLGDGFYEQKLVREQIMALTGQRFLGDYSNDEAQFMALMNSGLTYAKAMNLRPGVALSADQVAQLTSDMVWLVSQDVTLADGSLQSVLVPQVYMRVKDGDLDGTGALLAGNSVDLQLRGDLSNGGTIAGRQALQINADNIHNLGKLSADQVALQARQDLSNQGGSIEGASALSLSAGRDITVASTTQSDSTVSGANTISHTGIERVAGLYLKGQTGALLASAGRDLNLSAAQVSSAGSASLSAGRDVNLSTVTTTSSQSLNWDANNHLRQSASQDVGSQISSAGHLKINAGNNLNAQAASVSAGQALNAAAGNNINISAGQATSTLDEAYKSSQRDLLSKTTTVRQIQSASTTALGSSFEGNSVNLQAGQDLNVQGSAVLADQGVNLGAVGNVAITAAQNTSSQSNYQQTTKSGVMGSGLSVTVGKQQQSLDQKGTSTSAAASTVGSTGGNVSIKAGQTYTQTGSDVLTPAGNIDIAAMSVTLDEARETGSQSSEQKFKQSGVTVAVTSTALSSLQNAQSQLQAAGNTLSSRMQALATANAAFNTKQAADAIKAGQGDANGQVKNAKGDMVDGNAADKAGGISVSLTAGSSSSQSKQQSSADNARGSNAIAGGNIRIAATGAGADSDLTVQGSDVKAAGATALQAEDQISLLAASNTTNESSSQSSKSGSIGVAASLGNGGNGVGFTASASKATGQGAGNGTTYTNTHIEGGQQVKLDSGADTALSGATVTGNQVTANTGGKLVIESLQDQNQYKEKSQSAGGSVLIGAGGGGSLSLGQSKVNSNYTSVNEQSAIRAGDGGFQVNVQGKTELTGGQITSTQAAIDNNKNSYDAKQGTSTTDLNNSASYSAKSVSIGLGAGTPSPGANLSAGLSGVGIGSDSGSAQSTTTAGISGVAGNTAARTGDASTSLKPIFNKEQVQKEVAAQTAITSEFGKQASKAVGDYAATQLKKAQDAGDQAGIEAWKEGGSARVAMHTVVGGLTGGVQGAVGAATSQAVIDQVGQALKETNLPTELKQALVLAAGTAVGAATGGTAGAATAFNATANNYLSATDLRNRDQRLAAARKSGNVQEELNILKEYDAKSAKNTGAINYNSVLTEGSLQAEKAQLEQLVKDPATSAETKAQAQRSINELNTAINVIQKSPVLKDAAELGLIAADVLMLGEMAGARTLTSAVIKEFVAAKTGKVITDEAATVLSNNFYRDGAQFSSNIVNGKPVANLRLEYEQAVQSLRTQADRLIANGATEEQAARWAVEQRNTTIKNTYRDLTPSDQVTIYEARNIEKYGNPLGPSVDQLRAQGKTWQEIINSASRAGGGDLSFAPPGFNGGVK